MAGTFDNNTTKSDNYYLKKLASAVDDSDLNNGVLVTSGGGGGASTIADGADVAQGAVADAAVSAGAAGTVSAKLRRISADIGSLVKIEDVAHASGDAGILELGVANEAQTTLAGDGDYIGRATDTKGNTTIVGNVASGATDAGNPVKVGAKFNSTQPTLTDGQRADLQMNSRAELKVVITNATSTAAVAAPADGSSLSTTVLGTTARGLVYNGTTFDMVRAVANATNSTGTGIVAAGLVAQYDDVSPTAITENQFGNVRMNAVRALYTEDGPYLVSRVVADGQIKATAGFVKSVTIAPTSATPTAGVLTIYDNAAETGTIIYSEYFSTSTAPHTITLNAPCTSGIYVGYDATLAGVQATVTYR